MSGDLTGFPPPDSRNRAHRAEGASSAPGRGPGPGAALSGTFSWMTEMYHGIRFFMWLCARTGLPVTGLHVWDSLFFRK